MPRIPSGQITYGNAANLNGTSQYFTRAGLSTQVSDISVTAWIRPTAITAAQQCIFQIGENDANGYSLNVNTNGKLRLDLAFVATLDSSSALIGATTYFVAAVRTGSTWQLYINGVADGGTSSSSPNSPGDKTTIGAQRSSGGTASKWFGGLIDETRLYLRALTAGEIAALYSQGTNPNVFISNSNLRVLYKFDETSGNAADSSGNGLTLTNVNTTTFTTGPVELYDVPARTAAGTRTVAGTRTLASI